MSRAAPLLALALALAACAGNGAPSEQELRQALVAAGNRGGREAVKLACQSSPDRPGQVCDYRAPACNRFTGACGGARPFTGRFLDAGGRWQLVEDLTPRAQPDPVTRPLPGVALPDTAAMVPGADPVPAYAPTGRPGLPAARPSALPLPMPTIPPPPPPPGGDDEPLSRRELGQVSKWIGLDARCRAGRDYGEESWEACADRDKLSRKLERRGLCHVGPGGWQRC